MLDEQGKVTEAGKAILDWSNALDDYPVADEEDYSRRQYESQLESIQSEGFTEEQAHKIWSYLWDNDQRALEDDTDRGYVDTDSIQKAAFELGIKFEEDDCLDALETYCDIKTTAQGEQLIEAVTDFLKENKFTDLDELEDSDCNFDSLVEYLRHHGDVWKGDQFYHRYTPEQGEQLKLLQIN
jgi:hypothetical protein